MASKDRSKFFPHLWYSKEAKDTARSKRVTGELLKMVKIDIAALQNSCNS